MISSLDVVLPHYTLQSFAQTAITPDFTFYIDNRTYKVQSILISAISKVISLQISGAKPLYEYKFKELKDPHKIFEVFISLLKGNQHEINQDNAIFLNYIAKLLSIEPLVTATRPYADVKINSQNVFLLLTNYADNNIQCPDILKFIQSNWKTLKNDSILDQLSLESLKFLFGSPYFKQIDNNWYLNFVTNLIGQRGKEFSVLFSYMDFSRISNSLMCKIINQVSLDSLPLDFIKNIESRFIKPINPNDFYDEVDDESKPSKTEDELQENQVESTNYQNSNQYDKSQSQDQDSNYNDNYDDNYNDNFNDNYEDNYDDNYVDNDYNNYNKKYNENYNYPYNNYDYYNNDDNFEEGYEEEDDDTFYNQPPQKFLYRTDKDLFNGVFNYIMTKKPYYFNRIVEVKCGGDLERNVYKLFNYDDLWSFNWNTYSKKELSVLKNAWITIRFPYHKLCLSHYTLASSRYVYNDATKLFDKNLEGLQPKSWKIEGSDDMENWTLLSLISNTSLLTEPNAIATFPVNAKQQQKQQNYFSCFKLTLLKNGARQTKPFFNQLKLNGIEFYGVLMTKATIPQS